jgi:hypothetical protein
LGDSEPEVLFARLRPVERSLSTAAAAACFGDTTVERSNWIVLPANEAEGIDTPVGSCGVGRGPREPGEFGDGRVGLKTEDAKHVHHTVGASTRIDREPSGKSRGNEFDEFGDSDPERRILVADPFKTDRDGVGADGTDWSFVPCAPPALVYIIEPLGNRAGR